MRRLTMTFTIMVCFISLMMTLNTKAANPNAPAEITVTDSVVIRDVEPLEANLTTIAGGTNFAINNHVWSSGFEPIVLRKMIRIDRAGENWFEWDSHGGPGYWNLAWTGLGNGATVRFYRIVDAEGKPLAYGNDRDLNNIEGAHHVVFVGQATVPMPSNEFPEGGYIANDERDDNTENNMHRVYLDTSGLGLRFGDYVYLKLKTNYVGPETSPPDLRQHYAGDRPFFNASENNWTGRIVPHPTPIPDEFDDRGETCLKIDVTADHEIQLGQYVYHKYDDGEGQWYSQLHPGAKYRVAIWMRQEGLGNDGKVRFVFRGNEGYAAVNQKTPWNVTNRWQKFTYDFTAPAYPTSGSHIAHAIELTGPGTVWIDNFILYRYDTKHEFRPFTPHEVSFDEMMSVMPETGKKPAMRFYGTIFHPSNIEAMFTDYGNSKWEVAWNCHVGNAPAMTIAQCMAWAYKTGDTPSTFR